MKKQTYGILDVAKFISALLVIAIHCAPLIQVSEPANFFLVQVIGRLAVPFFFITSGWLFFRKIDPKKGWKDPTNVHTLQHYWLRICKIYVIWSLLYLPLLLIAWLQGGFELSTLLRLLRDIVWNGTYYHLWFLPALLLGVPLVYLFYTTMQKHIMLWIAIALYVIGMLLNVYGAPLQELPYVGSVISGYHAIFTTSRNGLFFAPIYLVLGIYAQMFLQGSYRKQSALALLISFGLYCGEAYALRYFGIMHDLTSMYLLLVPTIFFLFIFLMQLPLKSQQIFVLLRKMSLLIYVSHIYFIFLFLQVLDLGNLLVYILSMLCSCIFALLVIGLSKRFSLLKVLM